MKLWLYKLRNKLDSRVILMQIYTQAPIHIQTKKQPYNRLLNMYADSNMIVQSGKPLRTATCRDTVSWPSTVNLTRARSSRSSAAYLTNHALLQLQRQYGNRYVQQLLSLRSHGYNGTIDDPSTATFPSSQDVPVVSKTEIRLACAGDDSGYTKPQSQILEIMQQMDAEMAVLRKSSTPPKSSQEEAQRTFCIVKVIGLDGKVKLTTTGAFLRKGLHAEAQALNKLRMEQVAETDTVLLMVDQFPCEDKCTPILQQFRSKIKGEFRVFTKVKVNPKTRVGGSPKSAALTVDKSNQELMELTEFQKLPSFPSSGKTAVKAAPLLHKGKTANPAKITGNTLRNSTPKAIPSSAKVRMPSTGSTGRSAAGPVAASAAAAIITAVATSIIQNKFVDKQNEEWFQKELNGLQPAVKGQIISQEGEIVKLQRAGRKAYANIVLMVRYQTDSETGLNFFAGMSLVKVAVSNQNIHKEEIPEESVWHSLFKQLLGRTELQITYSEEIAGIEAE